MAMRRIADRAAAGRRASLDALAPIVVLIGLIALTIASFGVGATDGPLQVALMLSAAFAELVALKNGYTSAALADAAVGGVTTAVGAIFILLAVGALIGTWNMAGTIPTVVDYGVQLLNPSVFFLATAAICAIVGHGHRQLVDDGRHARRGVRRHGERDGRLAGDRRRRRHLRRLLRRQDDAAVGDHDPRTAARRRRLTTGEHIRNMFWTAGPALGISLVIFLVIGLSARHRAARSARTRPSTRSRRLPHLGW